MAYYAWTDIRGGTLEKPVTISRGSKVTRSDLGDSEVEWQAKLESGAIRDKPYPAPEGYSGSAIDYLREQLAEATSTTTDLEEAEATAKLVEVEAAGNQ